MFNNNYNPYYTQPQRFQPTEPIQPINTQPYIPPQTHNTQQVLLGKSVDSIDVVKAMDIPLDGTVSYFPLTDGSAIVTKKLQSDGTSKTTIYRPVEEENKTSINYRCFNKSFSYLSKLYGKGTNLYNHLTFKNILLSKIILSHSYVGFCQTVEKASFFSN